jgi:hypothetical protein
MHRHLLRYFSRRPADSIRQALNTMKLSPESPVTLEDVKRQFAHLSKTMHPDICRDAGSVEAYAEVQTAYKTLVNRLKDSGPLDKDEYASQFRYTPDPRRESDQEYRQKQYIKTKMNLKSEEEYLYYIIFGKTYEEDPEAYYLRENAQKRRIYVQNIEKMRDQKVDAESFIPNEHYGRIFSGNQAGGGTSGHQEEKNSSNLGMLAGFGIGGLLVFGYMIYSHKEPPINREISTKPKQVLTDEILLKIKDKTKEVAITKHAEKLNKSLSKLPENLKQFPKDPPPADELLLDYTIWKDIKTYTTFRSKMTPEFKVKLGSGEVQVPRSPIDDHMLTVYASIALEAERVLRKVYVDM